MSNQALPSMTLTEEQNKLVLEFREKTQESFTKLLQNLYASKLENPSLLILKEMASLVGDVIFLIQDGCDQEMIEKNNCKDAIELAELLCLFANNMMVTTVAEHFKLKEAILAEVEAAKNAVKQ